MAHWALSGSVTSSAGGPISAKGHRDVTGSITLNGNLSADFTLELPLARLVDVVGSDIRYDRAPGGFEMFAMAENTGEACAIQISGVTTIKNAAPPNLTVDLSWTLPASQIVRPGEPFTYHVGFTSEEQALAFPEGTASTRFSAYSVPCP